MGQVKYYGGLSSDEQVKSLISRPVINDINVTPTLYQMNKDFHFKMTTKSCVTIVSYFAFFYFFVFIYFHA